MKTSFFAFVAMCFLIAIGPGVAKAQDQIGPAFNDIPEGLYIVYRLSGGAKTSAVHEGWTDKGYKVAVYLGENGGEGDLFDTRYYDEAGNLTLYETRTETWSYSPHNCARTLGECRHTARNETKGQSFRWSRITDRDGDQDFAFKRYYNGAEWASGTYRTGEYGLTIAFTNSRSGDPDSFGTMVRIVSPE